MPGAALVLALTLMGANTDAGAGAGAAVPRSGAAVSTAPASAIPGAVVEPLEEDGVRGLRATFVVEAPADLVLETLWDVRRFQSIFPDIRRLEVLRAGDGVVEARFVVDAVFMERSYTLRRTLDRAGRTIAWQSIAGDVKSVRGRWTVAPSGDGATTRVTYTSFVDVGHFVPTGLVRDVALGRVEQMVARVRRACATPSATSKDRR